MRTIAIALALTLAPFAQTPKAGPAKEFDDLLEQASKSSGMGDQTTAIKALEKALALAQREPALKGRDADVLRGMGHVYSAAKQYPNAIRAYRTLLESIKSDCVAGKPEADVCADVYYDLGTAQMFASDFAGAAVTLRKGIPLYEAMVHGRGEPSYKMAKLKLEANTQSMLAAALFRSGNLAGAIATYEKAIQQYKTVIDNPASGEGLQMLARQSMAQEQQSLNLLKEEAKRLAAEKKETPKK
jgi:tetratricopeptide (TPR) repeat protein